MTTFYLVVGGLWMGSVLFFALVVLPTACAGNIRAAALESVVPWLTMWSRGASLVMFATGGHLAGTCYTVDSLFGSGRGHLVPGMPVLWFIPTGLAEVSRVHAEDGLVERKVRTPAEEAIPSYFGAMLIVVLLLVDADLLLN